MDFSAISKTYETNGLVQKDTAMSLLDIAVLRGTEDVLDVGCGPGFFTRMVRERTSGRVAGADPSPGMIAEAGKSAVGLKIEYVISAAEEIAFDGEFDAVFTNSAFQWFGDPAKALRRCLAALRPGGRFYMQAPARKVFCPVFIAAFADVAADPKTAEWFAGFKSPWFFLETAENYKELAESAGFVSVQAKMADDGARRTPEEALRIFKSGAAAAYLNQDCYADPLPDSYAADFAKIMGDSLRRKADADGWLELVFHRVYLSAEKRA
jgi:ubiquinone/menaquinone biosynthesis C-methylase UbiE